MPNIQPGQPVAPGVVQPASGYPQYGVGGGTPGSPAGWNIVTANSEAQKLQYEQQGYLVWFSTRAAAQNEISSQSSAYGSGSPPGLSGLAAIGDFFSRLTQAHTWERVAMVVIGLGLIVVGVAKLASGTSIGQAAASAGKAAALL